LRAESGIRTTRLNIQIAGSVIRQINRLSRSFLDKQLWVTRYNPEERYPEGKYPNRSAHDTGLGQYSKDNQSLDNQDDVVWMTTGTTHVARAEEWPIMPTEWVHTLLKPWNFFDETPTLNLAGKKETQ